jgi:phage terminase large subunit
MEVQIDTAVFNPVYLPYLHDYTRTQIFYGGSSSGKSVFLAQRAVYDLLKGGRNYLICREVARTVRRSVFNEIQKVIKGWGVSSLFSTNKNDGIITCNNGYQILFTGLDDTEKVKSITPERGVITDIWIEEATETAYRSVKDLYKRQRGGSGNNPKRLTLSFNPILKSNWIYGEYFTPLGWADNQKTAKGDGVSVLKTTYKDNRFLTTDDVHDLENERDEYYRNVYTLGNWGVLGNVIFTNWEVADLSGMEAQWTNQRFGLDFGFSNDPAAWLATSYDQKRKIIYIYSEIYERGLTNDMLAKEAFDMVRNNYTRADSAEPKSIAELQAHGLYVLPAEKGKDSVIYGIQWLQQQRIIIDKSCINTRNEFEQYKWREDKDGNALRQPLDKNNHAIDALRYAYEEEMRTETERYVPLTQHANISRW